MYDEAADLEGHRAEVEHLRTAIRRVGMRDTDFSMALDIGGGFGLHAPWLLEMCDRLYITDIVDYVFTFGPSTLTALADKFERNGIHLDRARLEYHHVNAHSLIYRDGLFDLCLSINALEHIPDPRAAFSEMVRVTRPGGLIVLQFDPLWNSPFGHHLWHLETEPWTHLMLSENEFADHIRSRGGSEAEVETAATAMNKRPYSYYRDMFAEIEPGLFDFVSIERWADEPGGEPATAHPRFAELTRRGFSPDELFVRGMRFVGRRA